MTIHIGLIGVGEAGAAFADGLRSAGAVVLGFDPRAGDPAVAARAAAAGVTFVPDLAELARRAGLLLNLTSAKAAVPIAREIAPLLTGGQLYADLNSASPQVKREAAHGIAAFTDGAVMAAVAPQRHQVPILLSGPGADAVFAALTPYGARLEVLGPEPGQASAVKMLRSLLVKGLESLLVECAVGAAKYGVTRRVLDSMNGTLPTEDWNILAEYLMSRTLAHTTRRAEELRQVASTLDAVGVAPLLASAGAQRLQWLADLDLAPGPYDDILDRLRQVRA